MMIETVYAFVTNSTMLAVLENLQDKSMQSAHVKAGLVVPILEVLVIAFGSAIIDSGVSEALLMCLPHSMLLLSS